MGGVVPTPRRERERARSGRLALLSADLVMFVRIVTTGAAHGLSGIKAPPHPVATGHGAHEERRSLVCRNIFSAGGFY